MLNDAESLLPGEGQITFARKDKLFGLLRGQAVLVGCQGFLKALVQGDDSFFASFVLSQGQVGAEAFLMKVIYISPSKFQHVANAQGSVYACANQSIVSQVRLIF